MEGAKPGRRSLDTRLKRPARSLRLDNAIRYPLCGRDGSRTHCEPDVFYCRNSVRSVAHSTDACARSARPDLNLDTSGPTAKEQLGTAEAREGRQASQVAANLGAASLLSFTVAQSWQIDHSWLHLSGLLPSAVFIAGLAALCEAAADTVSSELGQVLNSHPRMITTLRVAAPGTDGAISLGGTLAGIVAAGVVALAGTAALRGDWLMFLLGWAGGAFGLFFDSLLGATIERRAGSTTMPSTFCRR